MRKLFALSSVALVALTLTVSGCAKKENTETNTSTETTPAPAATTPAAPDTTMGGAKTDTTSHM
jgi:type IV pilus biogenesis protein CpaD/CtpE